MEAYAFYLQSDPSYLDQSYTDKAMQALQLFLNQHPNSGRKKEAEKYKKEAEKTDEETGVGEEDGKGGLSLTNSISTYC